MKTITEFAGPTLKNALNTKIELVTAGKTPEELPTALGEALKLEGDKLKYTLAAIELVENKLQDLKRVVVQALNEGEKAPSHAILKAEHYYLAEYYPSLTAPARPRDEGRDHAPRGGKRGDRNKKGGAPRGDRAGGGRRERSGAPTALPGGGPMVFGEGKPAGADRGPRGPRPPRRDRDMSSPQLSSPSRGPIPLAKPNPGTPRIIAPLPQKPSENLPETTPAAAPSMPPIVQETQSSDLGKSAAPSSATTEGS